VMALEAHDVEAAIASMKSAGYTRLVHPSHGRSVTRYRQVADEHHDWTRAQSALMAMLLLRGPQTLAELKSRTERQYDFRSVDEVDDVLRELAAGDPPLVVQLERAPGQKETRWQQLLAEEAEPVARAHAAVAPVGGLADRVNELEARVARLEAAIADLLD